MRLNVIYFLIFPTFLLMCSCSSLQRITYDNKNDEIKDIPLTSSTVVLHTADSLFQLTAIEKSDTQRELSGQLVTIDSHLNLNSKNTIHLFTNEMQQLAGDRVKLLYDSVYKIRLKEKRPDTTKTVITVLAAVILVLSLATIDWDLQYGL